MADSQIPERMKAVVLERYALDGSGLTVQERPVPKPGPGKVLVRVAASPINPSDLMFVRGLYGFRKELPVVPGFEGSGTVVACGEGLLPRVWKGRRVVIAVQKVGDGPWAEYVEVDAKSVLPLLPHVSMEQGACLLVNPMSALALIDIAKRRKAKALVHTAAGSALGRMIHLLGERARIQVIHVVRRPEQVAELKAEGRKHVLCSAEKGFEKELLALTEQLDAQLAYDAVGGELPGRIARGMPRGSTVMVYGGLALEDARIGVHELIFREQKLEGFWLSSWLRGMPPSRLLPMWLRLQRHAGEALATPIRAKYPLDQAKEAFAAYEAQMSGGKVLFVPGGEA